MAEKSPDDSAPRKKLQLASGAESERAIDDHRVPGQPADDSRPQDIELYSVMLTFIMHRLEFANELLANPKRRAVDTETVALNVRMALESIVLSALIANRPAAAAVSDAFATKTAADARRIVRSVNPRYWPIPFKFRRSVDESGEEAWHMDAPEDAFLREDEWGRAYGYCSALLHAVNPYQYLTSQPPKEHPMSAAVGELQAYSQKIRVLLWRHQIYLSESDVSLICRVPDDLGTRPSVEVYHRAQ